MIYPRLPSQIVLEDWFLPEKHTPKASSGRIPHVRRKPWKRLRERSGVKVRGTAGRSSRER